MYDVYDAESGTRGENGAHDCDGPQQAPVFGEPAVEGKKHKGKNRNREAREITARPCRIVVSEKAPEVGHKKEGFDQMGPAIGAEFGGLYHHDGGDEDQEYPGKT